MRFAAYSDIAQGEGAPADGFCASAGRRRAPAGALRAARCAGAYGKGPGTCSGAASAPAQLRGFGGAAAAGRRPSCWAALEAEGDGEEVAAARQEKFKGKE